MCAAAEGQPPETTAPSTEPVVSTQQELADADSAGKSEHPAADAPAATEAPAPASVDTPIATDAGAATATATAPEASAATAAETTAATDVAPTTESAPAPAAEATKPTEPETKESAAEPTTPIAQLWAAAKGVAHDEIWGVTLADPESHVPTRIILQKYLNANDGDLTKAILQLTSTLEWRAKTKPLELVKKVYSKTKFDGLGYVTKYQQEGATEPDGTEVFTWNIYGGVKSIDDTFGVLEEFIEWRVALMELALQELDLASATRPITADYDPYKIFQVHDYKSLSFLRQSPQVKSASTETIKVFAQNYPELLKEKFFVNVPAIMGFVYAFMKLFVAPKTTKKFHPMSNGENLAKEFGESKVSALGEKLPANYGGKGGDLAAQGHGPLLE